MKIIKCILTILISIMLALVICLAGITLLWILFDPSREWMICMPIWARFVFLIFMMGLSGFAVYSDYLNVRNYRKE